MSERKITTGMSGIWRNRGNWLNLGRKTNPVEIAGCVSKAASDSKRKSDRVLHPIRLKIMIYEADEDKYDSLEKIKI